MKDQERGNTTLEFIIRKLESVITQQKAVIYSLTLFIGLAGGTVSYISIKADINGKELARLVEIKHETQIENLIKSFNNQ